MTMRGHQSLLLAGPIIPLVAWWVKVQSMYFCAFAFSASIVEQISERNETVEKIGATFPGLAGSAEPATIAANVCPGFIEVTAEPIGLDLHLASSHPMGRTAPRGKGRKHSLRAVPDS